MYTVKKKIGNKEYYYLKISSRINGKVKSKTIAYLGKAPMSSKALEKKINSISKTRINLAKKELEEDFDSINNKFLTKREIKDLDLVKTSFNQKLKLNKDLRSDMFKDFKTFYIYNTNAIEGNSLTLQETSLLLNSNQTPQGKDLREIYDHINEKETFDYILEKNPPISKATIIDLHSRLLKKIDTRIGKFRSHNVRVFGSKFQTSDAKYVDLDMTILLKWFRKYSKKLHPLIVASIFHEKFERIHPFYDGNGRTGRMLLNLILIKSGFPPLIIKNKSRLEYYKVLDKGHVANLNSIDLEHYKPIVEFCFKELVDTHKEIFSKWG